jgi:YHS domain-containing protein
MKNTTNRAIKLAILGIAAVFLFTSALPIQVLAGSSKKKVNADSLGVAIKGYDTVAYFTEGKAVKGKEEFKYEWQNAKWRFSSAANRDRFVANPQTYAPQYGGF